jgi:hypothetical protein
MTENNQDNFTKADLAEFTEEVLLPAVERIVDYKLEEKLESKLEEKLNAKFGEFRYELKSYIDDKLADAKGEIIASQKEIIVAIKGEKEKDVKFKEDVVDVFKSNSLADHKKIEQMEALI